MRSSTDEALSPEAVRAGIDQLLATQRPLLNAVNSVRDLVRWRDEMVRLAYLLVAGEDGLRPVVQAGFTAWESLLAAGIARAQENGDLSPAADPGRLATGMMAALRGGLLLARTTRDVERLETALDMALCSVRAHAVTR